MKFVLINAFQTLCLISLQTFTLEGNDVNGVIGTNVEIKGRVNKWENIQHLYEF